MPACRALIRLFRAGALALLIGGTPAASSAASEPTALTARQAAAAMGKGFNLGQMFDAGQHPPTLDEAAPKIDAYYQRGFRVLRIPVTWTEPVDGSLLANPETGVIDRAAPRLAALTAVIDYALAKPGLYVVLNAHHEVRLKEDMREDVLERLWADISALYGDREHRLMFEILNEPHLSNKEPMPPERLRAMTAKAYGRIRERDAQRIILIGGNQWFGADEMDKVWPNLDGVGGGADAYLMATFHHYNPWTFNGDNQGDYADPWTDADLCGPMQTMIAWSSRVGGGMPIFLGEWGVGWRSRLQRMNCNNIRLWYSRLHRTAAEFGMPTAVWDDGGWFQRVPRIGAGTLQRRLHLRRSDVAAPTRLKQEPDALFGLINPVFQQAGRRDVPVSVAQVVQSAHAADQLAIVVAKLGQHVERIHIVRVIVGNPRLARDLTDRTERRTADLAGPLCDQVGHGEKFGRLLVEQEVIIPKVRSRDMPMEILGLDVQGEHVGQQRGEFGGYFPHPLFRQTCRRSERRQAFLAAGDHGLSPLAEA